MNKAKLVSRVAAETSTTKTVPERMVGSVFSATANALARDEPVAIAEFGKLAVRGRAAPQVRNPRTGGPVAVPASKVPSFNPRKAVTGREVSDEHTRQFIWNIGGGKYGRGRREQHGKSCRSYPHTNLSTATASPGE